MIGALRLKSRGGLLVAAAPGVAVDRQRFEKLVSEALEELPPRFAERLSNIDVEVRDWPSADEMRAARVPPGRLLLGLYRGVPQTRRSQGYNMALPDRIFIYQQPIERVCGSDDEMRQRVRRTVLHEIAHHFGWSDAELAEMER
jgi:predicted Zn-dependent protease with MMP-like domain